MKLSAEFVALLSCPVSGDRLEYDADQNILISKKAKLAYPIIDDIPMLLESEAQPLSDFQKTKKKAKLKEAV